MSKESDFNHWDFVAPVCPMMEGRYLKIFEMEGARLDSQGRLYLKGLILAQVAYARISNSHKFLKTREDVDAGMVLIKNPEDDYDVEVLVGEKNALYLHGSRVYAGEIEKGELLLRRTVRSEDEDKIALNLNNIFSSVNEARIQSFLE